MPTIKSTKRPIVTLSLPKSVPALLVYAQNIVNRMTANSAFPSVAPPLATITSAISDLHAAEAAAVARTKGAAATRDDKRKALVGLLEQLRAYIQSIANAEESNGQAIIESAGVAVRKTATRKARVFAAKPGGNSGVATVVAASAGHRASYEWQYSADGGKTWVSLPPTLQAKTTATGLVAGTVVEFKYRAVTKAGADDWSQPVSLTIQ